MPHPSVKSGALALFLSAAVFLSACQPPEAEDGDAAQTPLAASSIPQGSGFDFYVLSLSWSPSYCLAEGADANRQQCGRSDPFGFVVHGLWPQFESGYPEFCSTREPERVPDPIVSRNLDLMPSAGLIGHQWRKHGSCTGLSQPDYFRVVRAARERVVIPASLDGADQPVPPQAVEDALAAANPGLTPQAMAVACGSGLIREVRICLSKDGLDFRACPEIDAGGCKRPASMPEPQAR